MAMYFTVSVKGSDGGESACQYLLELAPYSWENAVCWDYVIDVYLLYMLVQYFFSQAHAYT